MISVFTKPRIGVAGDIGSGELVERMRWVIGIRWTVVVALLLVGVIIVVGRLPSETAFWQIGLAATVALLNVCYLVATWQPSFTTTSLGQILRYAQIPLDLLVFTIIVHFSGGVTGPVFVLYFLYIFVGLAILPPSGAYYVAGVAAALYGVLGVLEALWMKPPQNLGDTPQAHASIGTYLGYVLTVSATLMIIAYIANYFSGLLTRNEGTIREQLSELNALYSFTRSASTTHLSEEIVQNLVNTAVELERATSGSLLLFNDRGEGTLVYNKGFTADQAAKLSKMQLHKDLPSVKVLVADGKGVFAPDVDEVPGLRDLIVRPNTRSFYGVPMWRGDYLFGMLNLSFDRKYAMPINRWNVLGTMTQQAAMAIERIGLFTEAQRAARESASLYQIGLVTTSSLQIDEVMHLIYEQVNRALHPDTFYIALYDEDLGELRYDIFVEGGTMLQPFKARLDSVGIASWVIRNRRPIFVRNWSTEKEQLPFETNIVGTGAQSMISVPLIAKDKIVGVLCVQAEQPDAFEVHHLRLLSSIASQAALALENARLHATVHEQAQRDSLTGAFNHGTFIDKLNRALEMARDEGSTVALVMLDIDKFKTYNDTYGHLVGNDVLRSVVSSIQGHIKGTDVVGRWGGEEFAILLPSVSRAQARLVTERIRQTVAHNVMRDMQNRPIPSPTVSQGIGMYPDDAVQLEELIGKADTALYRAKDLGRNHIVEWISISQAEPEAETVPA
ncbi:MAG TPA: diguanylate cyclase [Chloroflexia bacterium]